MLKLRLNHLWHQKGILATLVIISLLMFGAMYIAFQEAIYHQVTDIRTVDMAYKALENFIFISVAGVFLFQQVDDHKS
jgi:hypothetical protein